MSEPSAALSIQQPWAWLAVNGTKDIENRKWSTSFRGPFFVHAGKRFDHQGYEWISKTMHLDLPDPEWYALGGIVGKAEIVDCVKRHPSKWFFGPYGFTLANAAPLPFIPLQGQLGFFKVPPEAFVFVPEQHRHPEEYYVKQWAAEHGGRTEVYLPDGTRCDCVTATHAIEFDFGPHFYDAIGQSLYYASQLKLQPGIVLILEDKQDAIYLKRLHLALSYWRLPIKVWLIAAWKQH